MFISASWRLAVATCKAVSARHAERESRAERTRLASAAQRATAAPKPGHKKGRARLQPASLGIAIALIATVVPAVNATQPQPSSQTLAARFHGSGVRSG